MADLRELIEAHTAALAAYDAASDEDWMNNDDVTGHAVDASRDALLGHQPATLEEVAVKAEFMASTKTFVEWDIDAARVIHALTPKQEARTVDLSHAGADCLQVAIARFVRAKTDQEQAVKDGVEDGPAWDEYEAAEKAVIDYPCRLIDEVREKPKFFLENDGPYDTIRNCFSSEGETLLRFLRSLAGGAPCD